jgi:hypothetical protein
MRAEGDARSSLNFVLTSIVDAEPPLSLRGPSTL